MRIAYFSPLSPVRSGISDYSEGLLPYLAKYADIDIFIDDYTPINNEIINRFAIYNYRDFEHLRGCYDIPLYHMGNNPFHAYIYETLVKYPGITVLHELVYHHFLERLFKDDPARYVREMGYCLGTAGAEEARRILAGKPCPHFEYPLFNRIVDSSLGAITHSHYVKNAVLNYSPGMPAQIIEQYFKGFVTSSSPARTKKELGLDPHKLVILSAGFITPSKKIDVCLKAFSRFQEDFPNSIYVSMGDCIEGYDARKMVEDLNLNNKVIMAGYVSLKDFHKYISASDICVNLRYPTAGETSASARRIMGAGKPIIVSNIGWFSEIPDNCCVKIDVGEDEENHLLKALRSLASNNSLRRKLGENARNYSLKHCDVRLAAKRYIDFINEVLSSPLDISGTQIGGRSRPEKDYIERIVLSDSDMEINPSIRELIVSAAEELIM